MDSRSVVSTRLRYRWQAIAGMLALVVILQPMAPARAAAAAPTRAAAGPPLTARFAPPSPPFSQCPAVGADTSCGVLVVVTDTGNQVVADSTQGPYDGADDTLVGVLNSSGSPLGSLQLSSGSQLFAFDGDGLCTFSQVAGCPFGPTGYEGPNTVFSNINPGTTGGVVSFSPALAPGASAYFSLEVALTAAATVVGGPSAGEQGGAPNPSENQTECSPGSPVNCATGELWHGFDDLKVPGRGLPLDFSRTYTSAAAGGQGPLGFGWRDSYDMSLTVDAAGNVTVNQENGSTVSFTRTAAGYLSAPRVLAQLVRNADGTFTFTRNRDRVHYDFSSGGRLVGEVDRNGYRTSLAYAGGRLSTVTDPAGRTLSFTYAGTHITRVTDPIGRTQSFSYDAAGNLATATDPAGGTSTFSYDPNHLLLSMTDPLGGRTTNTYDASRRVTTQVDPAGRKTTWAYAGAPVTPAGGTTTMTDPNGNVTEFRYQNLELLSRTGGSGTAQAATWSYQYDPATLGISQVTDPNGHVVQNTWDAEGNLLSTTDALGRRSTFTYDALNDTTSATDPLDVTTSYAYDANGNALSTSRPLVGTGEVATTSLVYGDRSHPGDVTATTDADGNVSQAAYDRFGNLVRSVDPAGDAWTMTYDLLGRMTSSVSPRGNLSGAIRASFTTTATYDALGQPLLVTDPLGRRTTYAYDANQNLLRVTDANGHTTGYAYDADNEVTRVTRADGSVLGTAYGGAGNVVGQTDGLGNTTTYTYDALNRLVSQTDPLSRRTTYAYDGAGNRTSLRDPQGQTTGFAYDAANQLTSITYSDGRTPDVGYTYDADGQRTSMTDGTGRSTYRHDSLHRLVEAVTGAGARVGYGHDLRGLLTSLVYPGGGDTVTRGYDGAGRLTSVSDWLGHTTRFAYDANSNLVTETYPNGAQALDTYDAANQLTKIVDQQGGSSFLNLAYARDGTGQVTAENDTAATYDAGNRQVGSGDARSAYSYDAADQPTGILGKPASYDPASELLTLGSSQYGYDPRGNRGRQVVDGRATNLAYDQANRLVGYGSVATYGYDGDGLRMSKTLSRDPQFTWDVAEGLPLIIQDGSTSYVTGPGGLPLEQVGPDGRSVLYYHQDQLGSTRALTDGSGAVVQTYRYDPYGNLAASSGSTSNPFRFAGQYLDTESGLYYQRARYYDPATAQFVSVDPVVGRTGQPYVDVADSPLNGVDPGGLSVAPCDDERCKELKRFVNDLTNGLRSKGRDIETNPKDLPESGVRAHQERWLGWQRGLQRLLGELAARGCDTQGVDAEAPSWANAPVPQPNVQPRPDPTQSVAAAPQHPWWIPGAVAAGGTAVVVIWFIGKLASPVCGPALPACAVAF